MLLLSPTFNDDKVESRNIFQPHLEVRVVIEFPEFLFVMAWTDTEPSANTVRVWFVLSRYRLLILIRISTPQAKQVITSSLWRVKPIPIKTMRIVTMVHNQTPIQ